MNISKLIILVVLGSLSLQSFAKEGYVDMREAFNKTSQGKRTNSQLDKKVAKIRKQIKSKEEKLRKDQNQLEKDMPLLSEKERARKIQNLQQKFVESKRQIESKQLELQQLEGKLRNPIIARLNKVIAEVAKKGNYTVIRDKSFGVLWIKKDTDLTKKVYTRFNKKYK